MDLLLNDEQVLLRDAAAKLGASRGGPRRARALRDAGTEIDAAAWRGTRHSAVSRAPAASTRNRSADAPNGTNDTEPDSAELFGSKIAPDARS